MTLRRSPTGLLAVGLLVLLSAPPSARAQVPTFEGEEVTVPGLRPQSTATTPAYVTVWSGEELRRLGLATLGDALRFLAEVGVRTAGSGPGGFQQVSIRGSTPQQVLVLIDGVPLNVTAQFGINLSTLSLAEVERVEILRGPYSAIYGSALGGVIAVRTRADARPHLSVAGGSFGGTAVALRIGRATPGGAFSLGGQFLGTAGDRPNSDAARWTGTLRLTRRPNRGEFLSLTAYAASGLTGLPGPTFFPTPGDRLADTRTLLSVAWGREADGGSGEGRIWWMRDSLAQQSPGFTSDDRGAATGGGWRQVIRQRNGAVLTWGVEAARITFSSTSTFATFQGEATTAAGYVQYDALLGQKTLLGVGVRTDVHSAYGPQVNPRLGFVHFLGDTLRLRGGLGRAFRAPTFFELAYPGCSNPSLRPEVAWAADLGLEATPRPGVALRLNTFYTDAVDLIVGGCAPQNIGSARIAGLSAEVAARVGEGWMLQGNVTWTDALDRGTGIRLLRVAPWQANLILRRSGPGGGSVVLLVNYVSVRDDLDTSSFPAMRVTMPGHVIVGLRYERQVGSLVMVAGVDNLLDAGYETLRGFPATRRSAFIQLGSSF